MDVLRQLRKSRDETQQSVADAVGITQQAYANYESGKREPDNAMLLKLARHYETSVSILLGEPLPQATSPGSMDASGSAESLVISDDARALASSYSRLSDGDKALVRSLVDSLAEKTDNITDPL